jgi:hypothetical protein
MITQARLKELLYYDPKLGWFMRLQNPRSGYVAGWFNKILGYSMVHVDDDYYYAHRLAFLYMTGAFPRGEVDHRDRNRTNNAWSNLRDVTRKQNIENGPLQKNNTSGIRGVYQRGSGWEAKIKHHGRSISLGNFSSKSKASYARRKAERLLFTHMGARV